MGRPSRATQTKRTRERANQERQKNKREERAIRKEQKKIDREGQPGLVFQEDPDLIGIIPGPQPIRDI